MDQKDKKRLSLNRQQKRAIPFFSLLAVLAVVAFILPLRPRQSVAEKRNLAEFPAFSAESFWNGTYFDAINLWFSDTFPGRELYIRQAQELEALQGLNRNKVMLDDRESTENDRLDALLAEAEESAAPSAVPEALPAPTAEAEIPAAAETEAAPPADAWAEIENWDGLDGEDEVAMLGNVVALGDSIFTALGFTQEYTDQYAAACNRYAEELAPLNVRFFNLPVPTSVGVLVSSDFLPQIKCADQGKILRYLFSQEEDGIGKVNVFNNLLAHRDEYIYFRGDHHWTALGAYYAYEEFCHTAGFEPVPLSEYQEMDMGVFRGTLYWRAGARDIWEDDLIAYLPPGEISMEIPSYPNLTAPVQDRSQKDPASKYNCFIAGDNETTVLTNPALPEGSCCMVIKDSFGNPFTVYLAQHYHRVVIVDYRHADRSLRDFVEEYRPQDLILINSIGLTQRPGAQSLLLRLLSP